MAVKSNLHGNCVYFDGDVWRYSDTNEECDNNEKPCARCGKHSNAGHDYCLSNLGRVTNACCGHGVEKGYIQFEDGTVIRGYFEIER